MGNLLVEFISLRIDAVQEMPDYFQMPDDPDNAKLIIKDLVQDKLPDSKYLFRIWKVFGCSTLIDKISLLFIAALLIGVAGYGAYGAYNEFKSKDSAPAIAVSGITNSPSIIAPNAKNVEQKTDYSTKTFQAGGAEQLASMIAPGSTIGTLIFNGDYSRSNTVSAELHEWITNFGTRLSETTDDVQLTKKDILNLTALLTKLDERTEDIHKLPDGRTALGYVVVGNPYMLNKPFSNMEVGLSSKPIDYNFSLSNALNGIAILKSSTTSYDSRDGNVYTRNETKSQFYADAAFCELYFDSNDLAVQYSETSVALDPTPANKTILVMSLFNASIDSYGKKDFSNSWNYASKAITNYEEIPGSDTNYPYLTKSQVADLYKIGADVSYKNHHTNEEFAYDKRRNQLLGLKPKPWKLQNILLRGEQQISK